MLYSLSESGDFHDVATGNNGAAAGVGYDLVTGIGTPVANLLIPALASNLVVTSPDLVVTSTTPGVGTIITTTPSVFVVNFNTAYDPSSVQTSNFSVNGVAAASCTPTSSTSITFNFSTTPVTAMGLYATLSGILDSVNEVAMTAFTGLFRYDPHPIQVTSVTPAAGTVVALPLTTFDVTFSEPYASSSISTNNLSLSVGIVTGFTLVPATNSVDYTLSGITQEGATRTVDGGHGVRGDHRCPR